VIKPFIDVVKEQTAPFFYSNSALLLVGAQKYYLPRPQGALATPLIAVD